MPPKVLFVNPPSMPYAHVVQTLENRQGNVTNIIKQTIAMPMGILYLASVLEREIEGIEIRVLDYAKALREHGHDTTLFGNIEEFIEYFLKAYVPEDFTPDMIGQSILFSTAHKTSGLIADAMKRRWPNVPVVAGGMHATNAVKSLLEMPSIDYVCRGEGEAIIAPLLRSVLEGTDCEQIAGIHGRTKVAASESNGGCTESAPMIDNLDEIPFPAWHLIPMEEYVASGAGLTRKVDEIESDREATIMTTRGCPFMCTFCSAWTVHGRQMRYRSVENVIEELELLYTRFGIDTVTPEDDLFTVKKPRIIALCNAVADHFKGALHFQFPNGLSVATLDRDVIDAMARMGMTFANIAIESGSAYVQKHIIKKNCNLERARGVVSDCRRAGVYVRTYYVVGFPGETKAQINETFDFAATLEADWSNFGIAAPLIGTEMYQQMLERGDIDTSFNWDNAFYMERMFDTQEVTAKELKEMVFAANLRINFFGNYNLRVGDYERAISFYQNVLEAYPGHLAARYCIGLARKKMGDDQFFAETIEECRRQLALSGMAQEHLRANPEYFPELADCLTAA